MEQMIPSGMVPGLVTIKDSKGKTQNVYPIDAKELISSGDYELVDNGAVEAARMSSTPLKSGRVAVAKELVVAEIVGIEGQVVIGADEKATAAAIKAGDNADSVPSTQQTAAEKKAETPAPTAEEKAGAQKLADQSKASPKAN